MYNDINIKINIIVFLQYVCKNEGSQFKDAMSSIRSF